MQKWLNGTPHCSSSSAHLTYIGITRRQRLSITPVSYRCYLHRVLLPEGFSYNTAFIILLPLSKNHQRLLLTCPNMPKFFRWLLKVLVKSLISKYPIWFLNTLQHAFSFLLAYPNQALLQAVTVVLPFLLSFIPKPEYKTLSTKSSYWVHGQYIWVGHSLGL